MRWIMCIFLCSVASLLFAQAPPARPPVQPPPLRQYPILTEHRLSLLQDYLRFHYGMTSTDLSEPAMIVVHYTAIGSLTGTLRTFKPDLLPAGRTDIKGHGDVNVSVHYVIAKDGAVYRLQPDNIAARHIIAFNWCTLGIELVARNEKELTQPQLASCARLCAWLAQEHPSVRYLIGHHEYADPSRPHYVLYREHDPTYKPTRKYDPGDAFMKNLRFLLARDYGVSLEE